MPSNLYLMQYMNTYFTVYTFFFFFNIAQIELTHLAN